MSNNEEQDSGSVSDETEEFTDAVADKLLGEITPVTEEVLAGFTEQDHFSHLAFDLYKETGILLSVCAHLCTEEEANAAVIERNHAICAGLLIRISKFTVAVTQLLATAERGKVVMALHRSVMESAINLRFLLFKNDNEVYQQFVQSSLAPERELVDRIQENIGKREKHEIWPIENRMLDSIQSTCRLSGVRIEDIGPRRGQWAGGMKERLKALGEEELYLFAERLPSHAVHGTWVDLLLHHLEPKNGGFMPDPSWSPTDPRLVCPVCLLILPVLSPYLETFFPAVPETRAICGRMVGLWQRIHLLDQAHEAWMNKAETAS